MSKLTYCANCGLRLKIYKKALPNYGRIIDLIEPHECTEEPVEFDVTPLDVPAFQPGEKDNKFVKKLNGLTPFPSNDKLDLRDRRPSDQVKSTAPDSLLSNLRGMQNTPPANDTSNEPEPE